MERRFTTRPVKVETRADGKQVLCGYAAVFYDAARDGTEYQLYDDMVERIGRGAFDRALSERHDAAGLFNHDPNKLLGRVSSGTMKLSVDDFGLRYEIELPDTELGREMATLTTRGDIKGSSFAFSVRAQTFTEADKLTVRTIDDVDLFDASPVTYPAYTATTADLRAANQADARAAADAWKAERQQQQQEVEVRLRMLELDELG